MSANIVLPTVEFPLEAWLCAYGCNGALERIEPVQGSWALLIINQKEIRMVSCVRCGRAVILPLGLDIDRDGKSETITITCNKCHFTCKPVFKDWGKQGFFCAAYEVTDSRGRVTAQKSYLHALNRDDALMQFNRTHGSDRSIHLVDVARVIGYFVDDIAGNKVHA